MRTARNQSSQAEPSKSIQQASKQWKAIFALSQIPVDLHSKSFPQAFTALQRFLCHVLLTASFHINYLANAIPSDSPCRRQELPPAQATLGKTTILSGLVQALLYGPQAFSLNLHNLHTRCAPSMHLVKSHFCCPQ